MKSKTIIIIISGVIAIMIVAVLVAMMKSEKSLFKSSSAENQTMNALIENYEDITDNNTQISVWMHVFKTCPRWKKMVLDQFQKHGSEDGTLEGRYLTEINWAISKGRNPADYLRTCNDENGMVSRVKGYSSMSNSEKEKLWVDIFTTCPDMKKIIFEQAQKWNRSPGEQLEIEVDWFMNKKQRDPKDFISSCN